jgi:excisionase family DNA binding protein
LTVQHPKEGGVIDVDFKILGTTDAAMVLGVSAEFVRQLERAGKLPAEKTPSGRRIFRVEDVKRMAAEREQKRKEQASGRDRE